MTRKEGMRVEKGMTRKKRHPLVIPAPPFVITKVPPVIPSVLLVIPAAPLVIPAEAGIQVTGRKVWIPALHGEPKARPLTFAATSLPLRKQGRE